MDTHETALSACNLREDVCRKAHVLQENLSIGQRSAESRPAPRTFEPPSLLTATVSAACSAVNRPVFGENLPRSAAAWALPRPESGVASCDGNGSRSRGPTRVAGLPLAPPV